MSVSADFLTYVVDQLAAFAKVRSRRMFGGVGLYADDVFFALIDNDTLYFKVDDSNRADYLARGCKPFQPFPSEPTFSMNYYDVPPEVVEDSDELKVWARKACAVALAKKIVKKPAKSKTPPPQSSPGDRGRKLERKLATKKKAAKKKAAKKAAKK
jgi:DNA transformation protein